MLFKQIVGQNEIKSHLLDMVKENRISHAQLFAGPEGCGNLAMAMAYIQYINCSNKQETDSCGTCPSCLKFGKMAHPDLHFVFPVNSTEKVKGDKVYCYEFLTEWRQALANNPYLNLFDWLEFIGIENKQGNISDREGIEIIKKMSLRSYEAEYKCVLMWMPEKMNQSCANTILKILEEPPEKTVFVLVSQQMEQILPTILSRTQLVRFNAIKDEELTHWLGSTFNLSANAAHTIALQSEGNLNLAIKQAEQGNEEDFNLVQFRTWMRMCYNRKEFHTLVEWINELSDIGRERIKNFLQYGLHISRECLIRHATADQLARNTPAEQEFITKFHPFINFRNGQKIMEELNTCYYHIERNGNPKIILMDASLKMMSWLRL